MHTVLDFNAMSEAELTQFASNIVQKINSEKLFSSYNEFKVEGVETHGVVNILFVDISHDETISVPREASWQCGVDENPASVPEYPDYENDLSDDAKNAFKTMSVNIDGYRVSLVIEDADSETAITDVEVTDYRNEDSGIGQYEFWGEIGYDTHPYTQVYGNLFCECRCVLYLEIEPIE
jgi:hypothetical protein